MPLKKFLTSSFFHWYKKHIKNLPGQHNNVETISAYNDEKTFFLKLHMYN